MEIKYNFDKTYSYTDGRKTEIDIGQTIKSNIDFWKEKYFELEKNSIPISLIEKEIEEYEEIGMIGVADCMKRLLDERR